MGSGGARGHGLAGIKQVRTIPSGARPPFPVRTRGFHSTSGACSVSPFTTHLVGQRVAPVGCVLRPAHCALLSRTNRAQISRLSRARTRRSAAKTRQPTAGQIVPRRARIAGEVSARGPGGRPRSSLLRDNFRPISGQWTMLRPRSAARGIAGEILTIVVNS
jgi:hypothetical protein